MSSHTFDTSASPTLCPFMPVFGAPQVMFVRGSGTELWDSDGKRYLDFLGGLAVIALGHSNPRITEVISEQAATLMHVSNLFATDKVAEAAIKINALLEEATGEIGQIFFCNSGAEANETALKLARKFGGRGRHGVVSAFGSFHGRTLAALAATGQPAKHEPFFPMPDGFRHVAYNDIAALEAAIDTTVAAVLLEPVQGEGGVVPADDQYLRDVRALCDERGLLFMLDEIQTGFGRTGEWFGFQHAGRRARCGDHGEGDGQRVSGGCGVGQARGRCGVPTGGPRQHLQRHRAGYSSRQCRHRRDAQDRCSRSGGEARRVLQRTIAGVARHRQRAWSRALACGGACRRSRCEGRLLRRSSSAVW